MAIMYPNAQARLLPGKSTTALNPMVINVHTMVGTLAGTENYFAQSGNPYSHFGTGGNGAVWQWQELDYRAASDLDGNPYCISIENEDTGQFFPAWSGSNVPRFTDAQAESLAQLIAWLCDRFAIPADVIPDSLSGRRGVGYHRLGIDPYRVPNGVLWSKSYAKACPGDRRIAQLRDEVMPRVRQLLAPVPPPVLEEDDMPYYIRNGQNGAAYRIGVGAPIHQQSITAYQADLKVFKQIDYANGADCEAHLAAATAEWQNLAALSTISADVADIEEIVGRLTAAGNANPVTEPDQPGG